MKPAMKKRIAWGIAGLIAANEIRGLILAAPVIYGIFRVGNTQVAIWLALCSLAGIAFSVVVPLLLTALIRREK